MATSSHASSLWPHRLAVVTAGATLLLIFVGGLVTNTGSGLAVPDWPTTFGYNMFLYPWSRMVGGILYEHSHRLIGSAVGMLTVTFAIWLWVTESRAWMRVLGVVAVLAVITQGVLGGLRVVLLEQSLAIVHGCFAHAFLTLMVSLAVCTSSWWQTAAPEEELTDTRRLRTLALITPALVYMQIVFGALLTHTGSRLDAHLIGAGVVTVAIARLAGRVLQQPAGLTKLRRPALLLVVLLAMQLSLGLGTFFWRFTPMGEATSVTLGLALETSHRVTGAAVLATSVMLALRIVRLVGLRRTEAAVTRSLVSPLPVESSHGVTA